MKLIGKSGLIRSLIPSILIIALLDGLFIFLLFHRHASPFDILTVDSVSVEIEGLENSYTFAWISDLHLIADVPLAENCPDVSSDYYDTILNRYENLFITADGTHSAELWPLIVDWLNSQDLDGVILGGDLLDYYSSANLEAFQAEYDRIEAPVLYIRSDHDYGTWYSGGALYEPDAYEAHAALDGNNWENQHLEFEDLILAGINASHKSITQDNLTLMNSVLEDGRPVIMISHVPYASIVDDSLETLALETRGRAYYWSSEIYVPNTAQLQLMGCIYNTDTPVIRQILAGHLHTSWDGMLTEQVSEHIFGPAYTGSVGLIHVTGAS